jgi:hypothetical protein
MLRDLQETGRFWFPALSAITGENPIPEDAAGDVERMTEAWIEVAVFLERAWPSSISWGG